MAKPLPSILITAGPTREYIDPTRFISNPSSGKMGYLLAEKARKAGCKILLISGPTALKKLAFVKMIHVMSAQDMFREVKKNFNDYDVIIMAAAVCDYRSKMVYSKKIKKEKCEKTLRLTLNPDILSWLSRHRKHQIIIGFAAETDHVLKNAKKKLSNKKLDAIIANRVGKKDIGFESDKIEFSILEPGKVSHSLSICKKNQLAEKIIHHILKKKRDGR